MIKAFQEGEKVGRRVSTRVTKQGKGGDAD